MFKWPNEIVPPILYANAQWAVTSYGIECLDDEYAIERSRLNERWEHDHRLSDWIVHLGEKRWVDIHEFADAFAQALAIHRVKGRTLIDIEASKHVALREARDDAEYDAFVHQLGGTKTAADMTAALELFEESRALRRVVKQGWPVR